MHIVKLEVSFALPKFNNFILKILHNSKIRVNSRKAERQAKEAHFGGKSWLGRLRKREKSLLKLSLKHL